MPLTIGTHPVLETPRLSLRPFEQADAPAVQRLAGAREIAATTLTIPHPYPDGAAEEWIAKYAPAFDRGTHVTFAVTRSDGTELVGSVGLAIDREHARAELGYWIGVPYWNRGYATEAARRVIAYGFSELGLNRIHASHLPRNTASGRVLQKAGMRFEGVLRQHIRKWGEYEDLAVYGVLAEEYRGR